MTTWWQNPSVVKGRKCPKCISRPILKPHSGGRGYKCPVCKRVWDEGGKEVDLEQKVVREVGNKQDSWTWWEEEWEGIVFVGGKNNKLEV